MRQYAWYSPELDVIVLQTFIENCHIVFEWGGFDMYTMGEKYGYDADLMSLTTWVPLGEL